MAGDVEVRKHERMTGELAARQKAWATVQGAPPIGEVQMSPDGWFASHLYQRLLALVVVVVLALFGGYIVYHEITASPGSHKTVQPTRQTRGIVD